MSKSIFDNVARLVILSDAYTFGGVIGRVDGDYPNLVRLNVDGGAPEFVAYDDRGVPQNNAYPTIRQREDTILASRFVNLYATGDGLSFTLGSKTHRTLEALNALRDSGHRIAAVELIFDVTNKKLIGANQVA